MGGGGGNPLTRGDGCRSAQSLSRSRADPPLDGGGPNGGGKPDRLEGEGDRPLEAGYEPGRPGPFCVVAPEDGGGGGAPVGVDVRPGPASLGDEAYEGGGRPLADIGDGGRILCPTGEDLPGCIDGGSGGPYRGGECWIECLL